MHYLGGKLQNLQTNLQTNKQKERKENAPVQAHASGLVIRDKCTFICKWSQCVVIYPALQR